MNRREMDFLREDFKQWRASGKHPGLIDLNKIAGCIHCTLWDVARARLQPESKSSDCHSCPPSLRLKRAVLWILVGANSCVLLTTHGCQSAKSAPIAALTESPQFYPDFASNSLTGNASGQIRHPPPFSAIKPNAAHRHRRVRMFCVQCGNVDGAIAAFCPRCGGALRRDSRVGAVTVVDAAEAAREQEALYQAVVGPKNRDYYLRRFARFDDAGKVGASWHWPAFFVTLFWLLYRKMWGYAFLYFVSHNLALVVSQRNIRGLLLR